MRFSLIPTEEKFFDDFNEQARLIHESALTLHEIVQDWPAKRGLVGRINELEHLCDVVTHGVVIRLNKTFVTPIDREDIHQLAGDLDDVLDLIQGAAVRMELFKIDSTPPEFIELVALLEKATVIIQKGIRQLPTFADISELRVELHNFESEGDRIHRTALAGLFENGKDDPLYVIKWKEIYDIVETAIDRSEDVFDVLEGIVLKHA